jgi:hypothetical protein
VKSLTIISTDDGETVYSAMRLTNVAVQKEDDAGGFIPGLSRLQEEVTVCQVLHGIKVRAAAREAVRAGAAAAVIARAPADSVSVRLVARRCPISREFPA